MKEYKDSMLFGFLKKLSFLMRGQLQLLVTESVREWVSFMSSYDLPKISGSFDINVRKVLVIVVYWGTL